MKNTQKYIQENKEKFLNELLDLLRIPSISADPSYINNVSKNALKYIAFNDSLKLKELNFRDKFAQMQFETKEIKQTDFEEIWMKII